MTIIQANRPFRLRELWNITGVYITACNQGAVSLEKSLYSPLIGYAIDVLLKLLPVPSKMAWKMNEAMFHFLNMKQMVWFETQRWTRDKYLQRYKWSHSSECVWKFNETPQGFTYILFCMSFLMWQLDPHSVWSGLKFLKWIEVSGWIFWKNMKSFIILLWCCGEVRYIHAVALGWLNLWVGSIRGAIVHICIVPGVDGEMKRRPYLLVDSHCNRLRSCSLMKFSSGS